MFITIGVVLLVLWFLGFIIFPVAGALIHILLVIALIMILLRFIRGK